MTTDDVRADARRVLAQIDRAQDEIGAVAADVNNRWRMSIPANPDRDTDLIICDALTSADKAIHTLLAELDREHDRALRLAIRAAGCEKAETERDAALALLARIQAVAADVDQDGGHSGPSLARTILNIVGGEK